MQIVSFFLKDNMTELKKHYKCSLLWPQNSIFQNLSQGNNRQMQKWLSVYYYIIYNIEKLKVT